MYFVKKNNIVTSIQAVSTTTTFFPPLKMCVWWGDINMSAMLALNKILKVLARLLLQTKD